MFPSTTAQPSPLVLGLPLLLLLLPTAEGKARDMREMTSGKTVPPSAR